MDPKYFKWTTDHQPYIKHIRFPQFKNFRNETVVFNSPVSVITGPNGSGKSSILQALYGAPDGYSISDFWFTTKLDAVKEKNRFIYGYEASYQAISKKNKSTLKDKTIEVIKQKMPQVNDADYWESADPIKSYGMDAEVLWLHEKTRPGVSKDRVGKLAGKYPPIEKTVIYLDFRGKLSAFDKFMYFKKDLISNRGNNKSKQDFIRERSKILAKIFNTKEQPFKFPRDKHLRTKPLKHLDSDQVKLVSEIVGKNYSEISILEHNLYTVNGDSSDNFSTTIRFRAYDPICGEYSDAYAGSGETSIVTLIHEVSQAPNRSLVLLDEPETSLHPEAQYKLKDFLLKKALEKKLQIVISSHSEYFIRDLSPESINQIYFMKDKFCIRNSTPVNEALSSIGVKNLTKKCIIVEDKNAKLVLDQAIKVFGYSSSINVSIGGGVSTLISTQLPRLFKDKEMLYLYLDGDAKPKDFDLNKNTKIFEDYEDNEKLLKLLLKNPNDTGDRNIEDLIIKCIKEQTPDLEKSKITDSMKAETIKELIQFVKQNIDFLPIGNPEVFICKSQYCNDVCANLNLNNNHDKETIRKIVLGRLDECNSDQFDDTCKELIRKVKDSAYDIFEVLIKKVVC